MPRPISVLDVGGSERFWTFLEQEERSGFAITLLNLQRAEVTLPGCRVLAGDACHLPFADQEFDLVFSNSVIEHVGLYEDQRRMASEVVRVGRGYMVQTPNRYFPIEPHFHLPMFQFLPRRVRAELLRRRDLGWMPRKPDLEQALHVVDSVRLLTRGQMHELFPAADIRSELVFGLAKSLLAVGVPGKKTVIGMDRKNKR